MSDVRRELAESAIRLRTSLLNAVHEAVDLAAILMRYLRNMP